MRGPFAIDPDTLARLSRTRPDERDRALFDAGLHSRRLVLLKSLQRRMESEAVPEAARAEFARHWRVLEDVERRDPAAARAVLGYPSVGVWLVAALGAGGGAVGDPGNGSGDPEASWASWASWASGVLAQLGAVAAAAALRARVGYRGTLDTPEGVLALPGIGVYRTRAARVRLVAGPRSLRLTQEEGRTSAVLPLMTPRVPSSPYAGAPHVRAPYAGAPYGKSPHGRHGGHTDPPGWSGLAPLSGTSATLDGVDPYRLPALDSGPFGLVPSRRVHRAGVGEEGWRRRWQAALALLASADPDRAAEVTALTRALVPLEPAPGAAASATLRAAPWAVFTTYPATALRLAEVLVHELQHSKLAVLTDLVALHEAGDAPVHRVGWRPDRRPLVGVLQGTYAHLGLADLAYRLAERPGASPAARGAARARGEEWRAQVAEALDLLLRSGQLTPAGREFTIGMREHHAELGRIGTTGSRAARRGLPVRHFR
ncbi:aKG-HExxH-type peptide beta-hydroxylase [Streptomyces sp. NPDC048172]|uniref:aKG-HExxH-type peptide beta-hydroxylase n=1 Tax=Streptomyces sp. NPDC048172 TaxID=3365505 RepID=UPI003715BCBE